MTGFFFSSDFWQHRCNRLVERLAGNHSLEVLIQTYWQSFKEEIRKITLPGNSGGHAQINVLSVQQGPTRHCAFYDWQHLPDTYRQVQLLRAAHASLRCALAGSESDKIIGVVSANLQEMQLSQVHRLCEEVARWWDREENVFLSPFSQMAYVMRNWLHGIYGDKPVIAHPSLGPIEEIEADHRRLIVECATSLYSLLRKEPELEESRSVGVVGTEAWAESVTSELRCLGANCVQYDHLPVEQNRDILMLLHSENSVTPDVAERLSCKVLVELMPGQINPESDNILSDRGITVVPDLVCTSSREIIEDWWIGGRRIPDWPMALYLRLSEIWSDVQTRKSESNLCHHDASFLLALQRLSERWEI